MKKAKTIPCSDARSKNTSDSLAWNDPRALKLIRSVLEFDAA